MCAGSRNRHRWGVTQRLGKTPEYGGSLRERPRRKAGTRARRAEAAPAVRAGSGRRSTPEVSVALVAPLIENLLDAAGALSELLAGSDFPVRPRGPRGRCEAEPVETVRGKEQP